MQFKTDKREIIINGTLAGAIFLVLYFFPVGLALLGASAGPLLYLARSKGLFNAASAAILASFIALVLGLNAYVLALVYLVILSLVQGFYISKEKMAKALIAGFLVISCLLILAGGIDVVTMREKYIEEQQEIFETSISEQSAFYTKLGLSESEIDELSKNLKSSASLIISIIPAAIMLNALFNSLLAMLVGGWFWKRKTGNQKGSFMKPFSLWRIPWPLVYMLIAGMALTIFQKSFGNYHETALIVGLNCLVFIIPFFVVQGFSIIWFFFEKFKQGSIVKVFSILTLLIFPFLFVFVLIIGLLDVWFDLRKLEKRSDNGNHVGNSENNQHN